MSSPVSSEEIKYDTAGNSGSHWGGSPGIWHCGYTPLKIVAVLPQNVLKWLFQNAAISHSS